MEEEHLYIMQKNHQYIMDNLLCDSIADFLWQEGAIDHDQLEELMEVCRTNKQKNTALLRMMRQKSGSYPIFLKALDKDSKFLSDHLRATDMGPYQQMEQRHQHNMALASKLGEKIGITDLGIVKRLDRNVELKRQWYEFALTLGIPEADLVELEGQHAPSSMERLNRVIYIWRRLDGQGATFPNLIKALDSLRHRETIDILVQYASSKR